MHQFLHDPGCLDGGLCGHQRILEVSAEHAFTDGFNFPGKTDRKLTVLRKDFFQLAAFVKTHLRRRKEAGELDEPFRSVEGHCAVRMTGYAQAQRGENIVGETQGDRRKSIHTRTIRHGLTCPGNQSKMNGASQNWADLLIFSVLNGITRISGIFKEKNRLIMLQIKRYVWLIMNSSSRLV